MANLDYKYKKNNAKHIFPSFSFPFFLGGGGGFEKNNKTPYHEMHECYAMQILKKKQKNKTKHQRRMVTKSREMKHKDRVKKTQLD